MFTRGKLAKEAECNSETIRYYENAGMLPEPERSENGYRKYTDEHLQRLKFIRRARELGFSIKSIKKLLLITEKSADHTRAEVKSLTQAHIDDISRKIADLEALKHTLIEISEPCDGAIESAEHCPIIDSMHSH